jgi:hypothetical protein
MYTMRTEKEYHIRRKRGYMGKDKQNRQVLKQRSKDRGEHERKQGRELDDRKERDGLNAMNHESYWS